MKKVFSLLLALFILSPLCLKVNAETSISKNLTNITKIDSEQINDDLLFQQYTIDSSYDAKIKTMKYIVGIMVIICLLMVIGMITIYLHYRENHNIMNVYYDDFSDSGNEKIKEDLKAEGLDSHIKEENFNAKESVKDDFSVQDYIESKESKVTHYWKRD